MKGVKCPRAKRCFVYAGGTSEMKGVKCPRANRCCVHACASSHTPAQTAVQQPQSLEGPNATGFQTGGKLGYGKLLCGPPSLAF
eukprot:358439-Chlamydomonas_euryale.AAC.5